MRKSSKTLGALAVACLIAAGGSAFTASNTVPNHVLGQGSAVVSGAVVTQTNYTLSTDKSEVETVTFKVNPDIPLSTLSEVQLSEDVAGTLTPLGAGWYTCVNSAATTVVVGMADTITCNVAAGDILVSEVDQTELLVH
jgi:hypothetical protein